MHNPRPARAALAWRSWQPSLEKQPEGTSSSLFSAACQEPHRDAALPGTCSPEARGCRAPALPRDGCPFPTGPGSCSGEGLTRAAVEGVGIPWGLFLSCSCHDVPTKPELPCEVTGSRVSAGAGSCRSFSSMAGVTPLPAHLCLSQLLCKGWPPDKK